MKFRIENYQRADGAELTYLYSQVGGQWHLEAICQGPDAAKAEAHVIQSTRINLVSLGTEEFDL